MWMSPKLEEGISFFSDLNLTFHKLLLQSVNKIRTEPMSAVFIVSLRVSIQKNDIWPHPNKKLGL